MRKSRLIMMLTVLAAALTAAAKGPVVAPSYAWKLIEPLGLHREATIDTAETNYYRKSIASQVSDAWATTGNLGGEGINMIFMDRKPVSDFFLSDAVSHWRPSIHTETFYNTRIPMTLMSYNTGGGRENGQDRLQADFSGNINKRAQVGALLDYLYSKGSYNKQAAKALSWGFSGSYMGERYEFQGFYNHWNQLNKENGGITDDLYITDPAEIQGGVTTVDTKNIPVNLNNAHARNKGGQLYLNHRYKIGYWHETTDSVYTDSVISRTYVPVSSIIWTLDYKSGSHMFYDTNPNETGRFFEHTYINPKVTHDLTKYMTVTNTVGISMLEGFHRLAKFGIAAYAQHQYRRYEQTADTLDRVELGLDPLPGGMKPIRHIEGQNLAWAGGQISKQQGALLRYIIDGKIGLIGPAAGDIDLTGRISTRLPVTRDSLAIDAFGTFKNEEAPYLYNNYLSNHFVWHNDFGKQRTVTVGGSIGVPITSSLLEVSISNLQNYIYFGEDFLPRQHSGSVQVLSARLTQNFRLGILHFDNRVTFQTSSNDAVLPLPKIAVYSNLYILCNIATLKLQLGVDCNYYTSYYGLKYQPATSTFAVQRETKVGNYPWLDVYANMKLGKTRFYVLMSHINQGWFGNNYFSLPHYPLNPRRLLLGLSVDFAN